MPYCVSTSSINMYADDTALYVSDNNAIIAAKRVTNNLTAIHSWCRDNHLLINPTKTLAMFFSQNNTKQRTEISQAAILLDGSPLRTVSEFQYLGVLLDSNLSFKSHINSITSRAYGALCTLRKSQTYLLLKTRKLLYRSLVLPHLEYCPTVWDPCTKQLSERVQNRAMRTILGKPSGTCSQPLRSELNWRTL